MLPQLQRVCNSTALPCMISSLVCPVSYARARAQHGNPSCGKLHSHLRLHGHPHLYFTPSEGVGFLLLPATSRGSSRTYSETVDLWRPMLPAVSTGSLQPMPQKEPVCSVCCCLNASMLPILTPKQGKGACRSSSHPRPDHLWQGPSLLSRSFSRILLIYCSFSSFILISL